MAAVTLKFHPNFHKYTNGVKEHTVEVNDLIDVRNSISCLFPALGIHMKRIRSGDIKLENMALANKRRRLLDTEDYFLNRLTEDDTEFYIVPLFIGGGRVGRILFGVALIAIAIWQPQFLFAAPNIYGVGGGVFAGGVGGIGAGPLAFLGVTPGSLFLSGISQIFQGVLGFFMEPSKPKVQGQQTTETEARRENKIFTALTNTTASQTPVAMIYGRTRVAGQFISGEIRSLQHGRNETVRVSDSFPVGAS